MSADPGWSATQIDAVEPIRVAGAAVNWRPLRRTLGVGSFGMNAYSGDRGDCVVETHTEESMRHEEIYLVVTGCATFTILDERTGAPPETLEAPAGTVVALRDPALRRSAVATEDGTTVVAVGAPIGEAYSPSAWEWTFGAEAFRPTLDCEGALAHLAQGLEAHPGDGAIVYQTACWLALAARGDEALAKLHEAVALAPSVAGWAQNDADLAAIRGLPGFPAAPA